MDRLIVHPGAIPLDTDILSIQRNAMIAIGALAQATLGTSTVVDGLACTATSPAGMTVDIAPGSILSLANVDATDFGSLVADTTDPLVKMGVNIAKWNTGALAAPGTTGQSINYLVEATFQEADGTAVVLPYYNPTDPSMPYSGPSNSGTAQNTIRAQKVELQVKAGTAATTGSQTTPAVDSGWVGLWVITVAYAQSSITSASIAQYAGAPFIPTKLPAVRGNNIAVYKVISGTQKVSVNGSSFDTVGVFPALAGSFGPIIGKAKVREWAAGGGAGGGLFSSTNCVPGSGGGGEYAEGIFAVTTAQTITVGAPGAAGTSGASPTNGSAGGNSSFGSQMTANGGGGGTACSSSTASSSPGTGGTGGTGGTFRVPGATGSSGFYAGTTTIGSGAGGSYATGNGFGEVAGSSSPGDGQPAESPGGGGGAGVNGGAPSPGATGCIIVEW